jgi:hypothetical protein
MTRKLLITGPFVLAGVIGIAGCSQQSQTSSTNSNRTERQTSARKSSGPGTSGPVAPRVPAHYETAPTASSLMPTLSPELFPGKAREAYQVAREIPQTLAQLPCYCHCDQSMGHKSLQSCFVDEHASMCAVCVDEALQASQLQKKGMAPAAIRDIIIAEYSNQ